MALISQNFRILSKNKNPMLPCALYITDKFVYGNMCLLHFTVMNVDCFMTTVQE